MDKWLTIAASVLITAMFAAFAYAPGFFQYNEKSDIVLGGFIGCAVVMVVLKLIWGKQDE